jgi:hypothetical protein
MLHTTVSPRQEAWLPWQARSMQSSPDTTEFLHHGGKG